MGSYLTAEITGPLVDLGKIKIRKLPTWELNDVIGWDLDEIVQTVITGTNPETKLHTWDTIKTGQWHITMEGNSKWSVEESWTWAAWFTTKHPTLTVKIREEWDNRDADEPGMEERVYRNGELVVAESRESGEVPMNLDSLMIEAQRQLTAYDTGGGDVNKMAEALRALIAGLVA